MILEKENFLSDSKSTMTEEINNTETLNGLKMSNKRIRKGLRFTSNSDLDQDAETAKKFNCSICKKSLSTNDTLKRHILSIHLNLKPFECGDCDKKFVLEKALLAHKEIHGEIPKYLCHCGEKYKVESSYKDHIRRLHRSVPSTQFNCTNCEKIFHDRQTLRMHLNAVHKPKTIECSHPSCNMKFSSISLMHAHYRCHSKDCKVCLECGKSFKSETCLRKHKLTHDGVRPFSCNECCKTYLSLSHLNQHRKRTHLVVDKFQCIFCGKCFNSKEQLTYHENAHQGEKPFICDICEYQTAYRNTLYSHKKAIHSKSNIVGSKVVELYNTLENVKLPFKDQIASNKKIIATDSKQNINQKKTSWKVSQNDLQAPTAEALDSGLKINLKNRKLTTKAIKSVDQSFTEENLLSVSSNETSSLSLGDSFIKSSPMNVFWDSEVCPDWACTDQSSSESTTAFNNEALLNQPTNVFPKGRLGKNITLNCTAIECQSNLTEGLNFTSPFYDF